MNSATDSTDPSLGHPTYPGGALPVQRGRRACLTSVRSSDTCLLLVALTIGAEAAREQLPSAG